MYSRELFLLTALKTNVTKYDWVCGQKFSLMYEPFSNLLYAMLFQTCSLHD